VPAGDRHRRRVVTVVTLRRRRVHHCSAADLDPWHGSSTASDDFRALLVSVPDEASSGVSAADEEAAP
jgi:hypothetical protein